jgi:hypothetical protein
LEILNEKREKLYLYGKLYNQIFCKIAKMFKDVSCSSVKYFFESKKEMQTALFEIDPDTPIDLKKISCRCKILGIECHKNVNCPCFNKKCDNTR